MKRGNYRIPALLPAGCFSLTVYLPLLTCFICFVFCANVQFCTDCHQAQLSKQNEDYLHTGDLHRTGAYITVLLAHCRHVNSSVQWFVGFLGFFFLISAHLFFPSKDAVKLGTLFWIMYLIIDKKCIKATMRNFSVFMKHSCDSSDDYKCRAWSSPAWCWISDQLVFANQSQSRAGLAKKCELMF